MNIDKNSINLMKKMPKIIAALILFMAGCFALNAQSLVKVSGVVTSSDDGLPMIGVAVMDGAGNGVITSLDGDYAIDVTPGTELTFSSIGYLDAKVVVPQTTIFTHNVQMQPESMQLDDVPAGYHAHSPDTFVQCHGDVRTHSQPS